LVKVAHHGSKRNTSPALLKLLCSPTYLISTNGDQFDHPDKECLAQILKLARPKRLYFNYRTKFTKPWLTKAAQEQFHYQAVVRENDALSLEVPLCGT
jgi:beta-lactamase superfamily II metal-dependent hydrolase